MCSYGIDLGGSRGRGWARLSRVLPLLPALVVVTAVIGVGLLVHRHRTDETLSGLAGVTTSAVLACCPRFGRAEVQDVAVAPD